MADPMTAFSVAGRVALVTGGTSGIGRMIAEGFSAGGARTYIVARDAAACAAVAGELSAAGGDCRPLPGDLSTVAGLTAVAQAFAAVEPALDILVNNAGALYDAPIDEFSEEGWDRTVDLNLKSVFFLIQKLLPALRERATLHAPSAIVNIGSVGGLRVGPRETYSYAASKAALHHMTASLAKRLGPEHITVNAIAPGFFASRMTDTSSQAVSDAIKANIPLRRTGTGADIGALATMLGSAAGSFLTGTVIPLDGGMSI